MVRNDVCNRPINFGSQWVNGVRDPKFPSRNAQHGPVHSRLFSKRLVDQRFRLVGCCVTELSIKDVGKHSGGNPKLPCKRPKKFRRDCLPGSSLSAQEPTNRVDTAEDRACAGRAEGPNNRWQVLRQELVGLHGRERLVYGLTTATNILTAVTSLL